MALKIKHLNKNYIPDITHPYGSGWTQPKRSEIAIDDTHAMMGKSTFDKLLNYSHSIPSAAYEGKMWKGQYFENNGRTPTDKWYLRWYGLSDQPGMVSNNTRDIIIIE